jgi:uncharacterized phage-associated protein
MSESLALNSFAIANYFIWLANETGSFISNLKLQKLVYYAQAWHLALHEKPLFDEDFEAWIHGPVIPELYHHYKHFSWKPIQEEVALALPQSVLPYLKEVADEYFGCDAYTLEQMTHMEAPWQRAREGLMRDQPSTNIILKDWMQEYYTARAEEED